jgi:glycosyltransferase involved in cell wall biosynthesis
MTLSVVILTYNEVGHIARALASVASIASEIFVIDSGSTDDTAALARAAGAEVLTHPFVNQAQQFQWALDNAPITADWVMRLDADEMIEPDLATTIAARLDGLPAGVNGVNLKRKHVFMGRWIKHGGRYPLTLLRIWRRGKARIEQRWMDEHMLLTEGATVTFEGGFSDVNLNDLTFFTDKHNKYATREAVDVLNQKYGLFARDEALDTRATSAAASGKRWLKEGFYNRLPFWVGPLGYFLYRYIIQLGFLDGREGLIYHGLQGGWYRFLVAAKIVELEREIAPLPTPEARLEALERLTGYRLAT